jgi:subtilisin family serine protease
MTSRLRGVKPIVRITSVAVLGGLLGLSTLNAPGTAETASLPPTRLLVKLRPTLAVDVEGALPLSSMSLDARTAPAGPVGGFLARHRAQRLVPLFAALVRQKKLTGRSESELLQDVRRRFAARAARRRGAFVPRELGRTYVLELTGLDAAGIASRLAALRADPEVEYAEADQRYAVNLVPNDPYFSSFGSWGQAYADLYGIKKINAPTAWDTTAGSGIVVAVVDTGLDVHHPDIAANVWTNTAEIPGNGIDDDGNGFVDDVHGWDFIGASYASPTPDNDPADLYGHGTHVAGTIAGVGNNNLGVIGVAWGAKVMPVRGLDNDGYGDDVSLAQAIQYAANNGADVMNNSWGGGAPSQTITDAMQYAYDLGVVIVAAAGNSSMDASQFFPAQLPTVIAVSSLSPSDTLSNFSDFGSKIDVAAPGEDILSLRATGTSMGTPVGTDYTRASGTSMATPHVAGVAALVLAQHPEYTNEQVRQVLRTSATDVEAAGYDLKAGYGRVDAAAALGVVNPLEAKIQSPMDGTLVSSSSSTTISGVARGPAFASYVLEYGVGDLPSSWTTLNSSSTPATGGTLGVFDPTGLPPGPYTIRLTATSGVATFVDRMRVNIADTQKPTVHITAPANGAAVTGAVTITVSATDNVGVEYVYASIDGVYLAGQYSSPVGSIVWNSAFATNGSHTIVAYATDVAGNVGTSAPISVTSSNGPAVSLTAPASGAHLSGAAVVSAQTVAGVSLVQFFADGVFVGFAYNPPYTVTWSTQFAPNGSHSLTALAYDSSGSFTALSAPVSVTTSNPSLVQIVAPAKGAQVSGLTTITAQLSAAVKISEVQFSVDGRLIGASTVAPYTLVWDSGIAPNGSHALVATVFDYYHVQSASSAPVSITTTNNSSAPYDPGLMVPLCSTNTGVCDSGPWLDGRGPLGPEPHQPSTINGTCADGTIGGYHSSPSNDRIRITTLDGQPFAPGGTVRIDATVWGYGDLDLFSAADATHPIWSLLATFSNQFGAQTFSTTYTLPAGSLQAVRAQFRFEGTSSSACSQGNLDDHDDIAFAVNGIPAGPQFFYTLPPCRVIDTRTAAGPYGAPALAGGQERTFLLAGRCGIPATAKAVSANITVTGPTAAGDLRLHAGGQGVPIPSAINFLSQQTKANNAIVMLSSDRQLAVRADQPAGTTTQFILDVNGYFE